MKMQKVPLVGQRYIFFNPQYAQHTTGKVNVKIHILRLLIFLSVVGLMQ